MITTDDEANPQAGEPAEVTSFEKIKQDMADVRAWRDSHRICKRCTFCGRCKRAAKRKARVDKAPVSSDDIDSVLDLQGARD